MNRIIVVIVSRRGETHIETKGFVGDACRQASRFLEKALGERVGEIVEPEFYTASEPTGLRNSQSTG